MQIGHPVRALRSKKSIGIIEVHLFIASSLRLALTLRVRNIAQKRSDALRVAVIGYGENPALPGLKEVPDSQPHPIALIAASRPAPGLIISLFFRSRRVDGSP